MPRYSFAKTKLVASASKPSKAATTNSRVEKEDRAENDSRRHVFEATKALKPVKREEAPEFDESPVKRFAENDTFGHTEAIFNESVPSHVSSKVKRFIPGMRRPFGVSFGVNGQLVIPQKDGTVEIHLIPSGNESTHELVKSLRIHAQTSNPDSPDLETRIKSYLESTTKKSQNVVWRLANAVWVAPDAPNSPEDVPRSMEIESRFRDRQERMLASRTDGVDSWFRHCCQTNRNDVGLLIGDGEEERKRLASKQTLESARAAIIASMGPGLGVSDFSMLSRTGSGKTTIDKVIGVLTGYRVRPFVGTDWLRPLAMKYWYQEHVLENLHRILEQFEEGLQSKQIPRDGAYLLLKFAAQPSAHRLAKALANLKDNIMDDSLAFHIGRLLIDGGLANNWSRRKVALLSMQFCHQLERMGLWHWAVYVSMKANHLTELQKQRAVKEILSRHPTLDDADERISFLTHEAKVPREYLSYSRGVWCLYEGHWSTSKTSKRGWVEKAADYFEQANDQSDWIHVFGSQVAPLLIMQGRVHDIAKGLDRIKYTGDRTVTHPHLMMAYYWFDLQVDFVNLQLDLDDLMSRGKNAEGATAVYDRLLCFMRSLEHSPRQIFPAIPSSQAAIGIMADWTAQRIAALYEAGVCSKDDLVAMLRLPLTSDTRMVSLLKFCAEVA